MIGVAMKSIRNLSGRAIRLLAAAVLLGFWFAVMFLVRR